MEVLTWGLVEKYIEIEKAHDNLCEQLRNKINFIHENVGKDYRTDNSWFDNGYTVLTDVGEEGEFAVISYECFRHYDETNRLQQIDKCKEDIERYKKWILENEETLKKLEEEEELL